MHLQANGVKGVVNMCDEYEGPVEEYKRHGIKQLRLRTVDHFQPSVTNLVKGVKWINEHKKRGERVYVHCKAGHGRSSALVMAWLMNEGRGSPEEIQVSHINEDCYPTHIYCVLCLNQVLFKALLLNKRRVRKFLYKQGNILDFELLLSRGKVL